jgi:anti-sigma-K factor RskA
MVPNGFRDRCAEFLLGQLEGTALADFEAELEALGDEGRRALAHEAELLGELALAVDPEPPPPALRDRLLAEVRADAGTGTGGQTDATPAGAPIPIDSARRDGGTRRALLAAAAVLIVALGVWNFELRRTVAEQQVALEAADRGLAALDSLESALRAARDDFGTLAAPGTSVLSLAGTDDRPGARARIFVDPESGRALVLAYDLPILSAGDVYQLWAIRDGVPASVGTFAGRADGPARLELDALDPVADADLFAVTIEPAPGQPAPTGTMVLISGN